MAVSYVTSSTLIESIKNRAMIPTNQQTFKPADFLRFANEEMLIGVVPLVEQFHEEYFIFEEAVNIIQNQISYEIPYRATGNRLRSVYIIDSNDNRYPLTRVSADDLEYYVGNGYGQSIYGFYVANNCINLLNGASQDSDSRLLFSYYMRPNQLVEETRVTRVNTVVPTANLSLVCPSAINTTTDVVTINSHNLSDGVSIIVTYGGSGTLPAPLTTENTYYIKSLNANEVMFYYDSALTDLVDFTDAGTGTHIVTPNCYDISFLSSAPSIFNGSETYDLIQNNSPHKTLRYDLIPVTITSTMMRVKKEDMRRATNDRAQTPAYILPKRNDIVALSGETIIPQIPDELHSMLAQRVACRCLEALGDRDGLSAANTKLQEMELKTSALINDRVESSPQKVVNHNSPLRQRFLGSKISRS